MDEKPQITKITGITPLGEEWMAKVEAFCNDLTLPDDAEFTFETSDGQVWQVLPGELGEMRKARLASAVGKHKHYCRSCTEGTGSYGDDRCRG